MSLFPGIGKKLKRRQVTRVEWKRVMQALRDRANLQAGQLARIVDRHAPTLFDGDQLAHRAYFLDRFAPAGRLQAARHMVRVSNGRPGIHQAMPRAVFPLKGYFHVMPKAKLPADLEGARG